LLLSLDRAHALTHWWQPTCLALAPQRGTQPSGC